MAGRGRERKGAAPWLRAVEEREVVGTAPWRELVRRHGGGGAVVEHGGEREERVAEVRIRWDGIFCRSEERRVGKECQP